MTNQSTMDKLIEMRLTAMADAFRNQLDDPKFKGISFEDQFGMLVDIEYSSRKNNRLKRLIKNAGFDQPEANIMDIKYYMFADAEYIQRQSFCIVHTLSYKFEKGDDFHDIMMDTIEDIQKRNGYFYISSLVKECDVKCFINNKNVVNITYTVLCKKKNAKEVCLQLLSNDIAMFTRSF